jgi:hypothetical protein
MIRIPLRVIGVDLDDDATLELLAERLTDLAWSESDGVVTATIHTPAKDPVGVALQTARRIRHALPDAEVLEVDQELVSISDIASRLGVSREAVRLWVEGRRGPGGFPLHVGVVSNGKSKLWRWPDVQSWMHEHYRLGDDDRHLSRQQVVELDAALLRVRDDIDNRWEMLSPGTTFSSVLSAAAEAGAGGFERENLSVLTREFALALAAPRSTRGAVRSASIAVVHDPARFEERA